jgi:repressor LexA
MAEEEALGILKIDRNLIGRKSKENLFGLIVKGDSMNERVLDGIKIEEGNYLIVDKDAKVEEGDAVVAIIDSSATVKNISLKTEDVVVLYPESDNPTHQPIYIDSDSNFMINGKVIKVLDNPMTSI